VEELHARVAEYTAAQDWESLWGMCRDMRPSALPADPTVAVTLDLCRARGAQGRGDRETAQRVYQEVLRQVVESPVAPPPLARKAASEARYRLGELAESAFRDYPLCLRELGISWASRQEAREKVALLRAAERAYQDARRLAESPWRARAAFRVAAMNLAFYQEVATQPATTFRGLQGPPPLARARVGVASLVLERVLDPQQAEWPRAIADALRAAVQRAEADGEDADLVRDARGLLAQAQALRPPPQGPVAPPWPSRVGNPRGLKGLHAEREEIVLEDGGGKTRREPVAKAGPLLLEMVRGGVRERWAPEAAVALGLAGYRPAVAALTEAARGDDPELAVAATFALGELGTAAEVPVLVGVYAAASPTGDGPEPFETPAAALFGLRERALEALAKVGRREPRALDPLLRAGPVPRREVSYVLWNVGHKDLAHVYRDLLRDPDDATAAFAVLGLAAVSPSEAQAAVLELAARRPAACWASHLRGMGRGDGSGARGP
jgi:hypothetical protein